MQQQQTQQQQQQQKQQHKQQQQQLSHALGNLFAQQQQHQHLGFRSMVQLLGPWSTRSGSSSGSSGSSSSDSSKRSATAMATGRPVLEASVINYY